MAEWIKILEDGEPKFDEKWDIVYSCSNCCHSVIGNGYNYCPWCGEKITRTPKERGADKPKVTCLNCKYLEITLPYGECSRQLRIVKPDDTCEYAEPKERGGEK